MPTSNRDEIDSEILFYIKLVDKVRKSKNPEVVDAAFQKIANALDAKIRKVAGKFKIPGFSFDDVFQESLVALRYKAIKDYNKDRGSGEGPAAFDRFALLCIKRHLSTALKTSHQNKKRAMANPKSLDQDNSGSDDSDLSLMNILPITKGDIGTKAQNSEYFKDLINKLLQKLSVFEKQVFFLYAKDNSYVEIAELIFKTKNPDAENIKAVDNSLSRIKNKAKEIIDVYDSKGSN